MNETSTTERGAAETVPAEFKNAKFIWTSSSRDRYTYALFRHTFELADDVDSAKLCLFADTRYRLLVNGELICHGPARFKKPYPECDAIDLKSRLSKGRNVIAVMVVAWHSGTFISDPGAGGLIAGGEVKLRNGSRIELASGERWKAMVSPGHEAGMPDLSFAVGPGEWLDGRRMPSEWAGLDYDDGRWEAAEEVADPPWKRLARRSIPMLDERERLPERVAKAYRIGECESFRTYSDRVFLPEKRPVWYAARSFVWSEEDQTARLRWGQGKLAVNGVLAKQGNGEGSAALKRGWNEVLAIHFLHRGVWEFAVGFPEAMDLELRREPESDAEEGFQLSGPHPVADPREGRRMFGEAFDLSALSSEFDWRGRLAGRERPTPMLEREWSDFEPVGLGGEDLDAANQALAGVSRSEAGMALLFDFGGEVLGRPRIELTAPPGTVIDVTYSERLERGQSLPAYQGTRMAERYVCREGRQSWHGMSPRGLRYMELIVRGNASATRIHRVGLTSALYPVEELGAFRCGDPRLNRLWEMGRRTQAVCMEDGFLDCPWRERGIYTGDVLVQFYTNLACFGDHALMRRSIEIFFLAQDDSGLLPPCPHGLENMRHPDYSAIAVQALRHYWSITGDKGLVLQLIGRLEPLLEGLRRLREAGSLLVDGDGTNPYIDISMHDKAGVSCGLNCFVKQAFSEAATLFQLVGQEDTAKQLREEAEAMAEQIRSAFLDEESGLFNDRRRADRADTAPSVVGNTLALLYGVAPREREKSMAAWLRDRLGDNFCHGAPERHGDYHCSPYFSFYALQILYQFGYEGDALAYMRRCWGYMLDEGAWTFWEFFAKVCSLCHAWSTSPTQYLSSQLLGIRPAGDGDPDRFVFDPKPGDQSWAEGAYPHRSGPIRVRWQLDARGKIVYSLSHGSGVRVDVAEGLELRRE